MVKLSRNAIIGYPCGIITGVTYGLNPLFAKPLMNAGASTEAILFFRYAIAVLLLGGFLMIRRKKIKITLKQPGILLVLGLLFTASSTFLFEAYKYIASGLATTLVDRALFNVACIVAHRMRKADFHTSCVSVFIKHKDFSVVQKQHQIPQPTNITAVILNEARALIRDIWDSVSPIRQIGLGVSKLSHENAVQMSLFEDPKMDFYREWDRKYDEEKSQNEDDRTLAYERMKQ